MTETEIPIPTISIDKPNQLVRIRYRNTDRMVDIIDTLNDVELDELSGEYNLKGCKDINNAIRTRIRGLPYKKHNGSCGVLVSLIFLLLMLLIVIFGFISYSII